MSQDDGIVARSATTPTPVSDAAPAGTTPPDALKIEDREELMYLLGEAAELEHGILCTYLFAAFSLKTDAAEGLTPDQARAAAEWKKSMFAVAVQEMVHLTLVTNVLTAVGGAPHLGRPNLPQRSLYAPEIQLTLAPFGERTLERFLWIERPEDMDIGAMVGDFRLEGPRVQRVTGPMILAAPEDFSSIGQLYRGIERGLRWLVDKYGEAQVFVGPPRAQATQRYFRFHELIPVTDLASAVTAIETIVEEGEGARGDWKDAHFGRFVTILEEFRALKQQDPAYMPARPVLENPYAHIPGDAGAGSMEMNLIDHASTASVSDLFNAGYAVMLQLLYRFFGHTEESDDELGVLSNAAVDMMFLVIEPLGTLLTTLPAGARFPGMTAGPNFVTSRLVRLTPHKAAAWTILRERLLELADFCDPLLDSSQRAALAGVQQGFRRVAAELTPAE